MRPRYLVCITLLGLCHPHLGAQALTNALPPASSPRLSLPDADSSTGFGGLRVLSPGQIPDDPGQETLPLAQPEPPSPTGVPVVWEARHQSRKAGTDTLTLEGDVEMHYRGYILRADKVVFNRKTSELEAEGHLELTGGPEDIYVKASNGDMRLDMHTARFFNVTGSMGVRKAGRTSVYTTVNPLLFSGRVLLEIGEGKYRLIDGSMTNCRLPRPDWSILSHSINLENGNASATRAYFKFLGVPLFFLPYLSHPTEGSGRQSGLLIPVISNSSIKGFVVGEQYYWAVNRSTDLVIGSEYYSKRGWAPNGDFRYKGHGLDRLLIRWNGLIDRGVEEPGQTVKVNQGGVDIFANGRRDFSSDTRVAGDVEFLSSYIYRLVFNDNYALAVSSQVQSNVSLAHSHNGVVPSASLERFQTFASATTGDEARILHLPNLRFDIVDHPIATGPAYFGMGSSLGFMDRSSPDFHARNLGRFDLYPRLSLPLSAAGWSFVPEGALRATLYTISQAPDLLGLNRGIPTVSHDAIHRFDIEGSLDIRPPAFERDFTIGQGSRQLRHVIEPELTYRIVKGIGPAAQDVLRVDTTDIATNTDEAGYSLTQRFYLRSPANKPCSNAAGSGDDSLPRCLPPPREWASWQIAQKFYIDSDFGGAIISGRRNVFASTLDLSAVAFLTEPRNISPIVSRMRFEAIEHLRIQWDLDYDPKEGRMSADNIFAGYSLGSTTFGLGHALLNAVEETGSSASMIQSNELQPFLSIGKPSRVGFNLAANASYDFVNSALQYAGIQAVYNWDCCGLTLGYRKFSLGSFRNETQWLYSFTLANFGSVGDIRRVNSVFRDPSLPPIY